MSISFNPGDEKHNSNIVISDKYEIKRFGSFVFYNDTTLTCCSEDVFRANNGKIKKSNKLNWRKLINTFDKEKVPFLNNSDIYLLPCGDFVLVSDNCRMLVFSDDILDVNPDIKELPLLELTIDKKTNREDFFSELVGEKITDVFLPLYDYFIPTHFCFGEDKCLVVYCFWKLIHNNNMIYNSYMCRNEDEKENVITKVEEHLKNRVIISIISYDNVITRIIFSDDYELYIYIDNRFYYMPQIVIYHHFVHIKEITYNHKCLQDSEKRLDY